MVLNASSPAAATVLVNAEVRGPTRPPRAYTREVCDVPRENKRAAAAVGGPGLELARRGRAQRAARPTANHARHAQEHPPRPRFAPMRVRAGRPEASPWHGLSPTEE